jgi:anti-sigma factor RsiW
MECEITRERMSLWLDDQLDSQQLQAVEAHTAICPSCRAALEALRRVDWLLVSAPMVAPTSGFTLRFQAKLAARHRRRHTWAGLLTLTLATVALWLGVAALVAVSGLAIWQSVSASGLLTQAIGLLLEMGRAAATALNVAWLVLSALAQGLQHPVFIAYAVATAILAALWTQVITRRVLVRRPVAADVLR